VQEQNHLSDQASKGLLEGIFGKSGNPAAEGRGQGRRGIILTGHDHAGCDVYHYINQTSRLLADGVSTAEPEWDAVRWYAASASGLPQDPSAPGLREVTVRSIMGDFGGNIGMLSLSFDKATGEWVSAFSNCALGGAWIWWATKVLQHVTLALCGVTYLLWLYAHVNPSVAAGPLYRDHRIRDAQGNVIGRRSWPGEVVKEEKSGRGSPELGLQRLASKKAGEGAARPRLGSDLRTLSAVFETPDEEDGEKEKGRSRSA
jgi:hypothetical protein